MTSRKSNRFRSSLAELWRLIEARQRRELGLLVGLTVTGALAEAVTIGAVVPFLALLAAAPAGRHIGLAEVLFDIVDANTPESLNSSRRRSSYAWLRSRPGSWDLLTRKTRDFGCAFGHRLAVELQRRMLLQPYSWHVRHNSSEQLAAIEKAELVAQAVVLPLVQAVAASVIGIVIVAVLVETAPVPTVVAILGLGAIYYLLGAFARKRLDFYSSQMDDAFDRRIRIVQEGLGGIRDVILDGTQDRVIDEFRAADWQLARSRADAAFVASVPRFLIESVGIIVIAALSLALSRREGGFTDALPILGALALGAQRLLPVMQQLYGGWTNVAANNAIVLDVVRRLSLPVPAETKPVAPHPFVSKH